MRRLNPSVLALGRFEGADGERFVVGESDGDVEVGVIEVLVDPFGWDVEGEASANFVELADDGGGVELGFRLGHMITF